MKGAQEIINARMNRRSPPAVYIIDHPSGRITKACCLSSG